VRAIDEVNIAVEAGQVIFDYRAKWLGKTTLFNLVSEFTHRMTEH
jgi:ABC-type branched-subunit amino acid transport system ATPase component